MGERRRVEGKREKEEGEMKEGTERKERERKKKSGLGRRVGKERQKARDGSW